MGTRKGMTLIEVIFAIGIAAILGTAVVSAMVFGIYAKQHRQEYNGAMRLAADQLENTKRVLFHRLESQTLEDVVIDDGGTPDVEDDDVTGTLKLQFFDKSGNEVGTDENPLPLDKSKVLAKVTVEWTTIGYRSEKPRTLTLSTLLAP